MQRFKSILLVVGKSQVFDSAAEKALELAKTNGAKLTVIDVVQTSSISRRFQIHSEKMDQIHEQVCAERHQEIEEQLHQYRDGIDIQIKILSGKPFLEIIKYVLEYGCDLVIKASEQEKRFASILFGSTDLRLLRKCPCPVWLVKQDGSMKNKRILAAIELESLDDADSLDQINLQIVEIASTLAFRESRQLDIVNAWIVFGEEMLEKKLAKLYEEDVETWMEDQKKNIETAQAKFIELFRKYLIDSDMEELEYRFHSLEGEAEDVILDIASERQADLLVMGTVARSDLAGFFLGNTSEAILSQINCSVLAIKPPGFKSPVTPDNK